MDAQREARLAERYPIFYGAYDHAPADYDDEPVPPLTVDGFACDDGWCALLEAAGQAIEQQNEADDEPTVRAIQVKEKFGQLRLYTDKSTPEAYAVTKLVETLSAKMCEWCGKTKGTRRRDQAGHLKTLCVSCAAEWAGLPDEVEIWKFPTECHKCETDISVVYPRGVGGPHGGTWEAVGETLADQPYCNVEKTYSEVQDQPVWGNICTECGAYQGNYHVYTAATERADAIGDWTETDDEFCHVDTVEASY